MGDLRSFAAARRRYVTQRRGLGKPAHEPAPARGNALTRALLEALHAEPLRPGDALDCASQPVEHRRAGAGKRAAWLVVHLRGSGNQLGTARQSTEYAASEATINAAAVRLLQKEGWRPGDSLRVLPARDRRPGGGKAPGKTDAV